MCSDLIIFFYFCIVLHSLLPLETLIYQFFLPPMSTVFGYFLNCSHQCYFFQPPKKSATLEPTFPSTSCLFLCFPLQPNCSKILSITEELDMYTVSNCFLPTFCLTTPNWLLFSTYHETGVVKITRDLCIARSSVQLPVLMLPNLLTFNTDPSLIQFL